jgi:peptidoglycan/LPS O-acetylase OafA/YrhL
MTKRISELDGVRALAVGLVFFNHFAPIKSAPWLDLIHRVGWVGVDVFFVLSGFLVTTILLKARENPEGYFRNFYARRSLRIFPLYYLLLTGTVVVMSIAKHGLELQRMMTTWGNPLWYYAYLGNVVTAVTNVSPPGYFVPMWSLHVEEQFYLLLPPLVLYLGREHLKRVMIAAVLLAPAIRLLLAWSRPDLPSLQYELFPCRMDSLALGGLMAVYTPDPEATRRWRLPLFVATAGLLILAVGVFQRYGGTFDGTVERTIGYTLFDLAFAGFITLVLSLRGTPATAWLNWKPLQYVGMISYGLYLFQFPAEGLVNRIAHSMSLDWDGTIVKFVVVALTCLALATISWYMWETKWLAMKGRFAEVGPETTTAPAEALASEVASTA